MRDRKNNYKGRLVTLVASTLVCSAISCGGVGDDDVDSSQQATRAEWEYVFYALGARLTLARERYPYRCTVEVGRQCLSKNGVVDVAGAIGKTRIGSSDPKKTINVLAISRATPVWLYGNENSWNEKVVFNPTLTLSIANLAKASSEVGAFCAENNGEKIHTQDYLYKQDNNVTIKVGKMEFRCIRRRRLNDVTEGLCWPGDPITCRRKRP